MFFVPSGPLCQGELEAALERERATVREVNAELQRRSMYPQQPTRGIEMWDLRQARR